MFAALLLSTLTCVGLQRIRLSVNLLHLVRAVKIRKDETKKVKYDTARDEDPAAICLLILAERQVEYLTSLLAQAVRVVIQGTKLSKKPGLYGRSC